jgi:hypothetical protein
VTYLADGQSDSVTTPASAPAPAALEPAAGRRPREQRWPAGLAILAVVLLIEVMSGRITIFPVWLRWAVAALVIVPITVVQLTPHPRRWVAVERWVTYAFCAVTLTGTVANLANLVNTMVSGQEVTGRQLLASAIAVWLVNVLSFSLLYWQLDRGGPFGREGEDARRPDWGFPQESAPPDDVAPGWRPAYADYMFLAYCTATAFSPTEALPLTTRAKMLMMIESSISLATIIVVASRAINILA